MDWNWYFSALAQSAAAIVGIFGAFVVTKILTNQATFSQKTNRARDLLSSCRKLIDDADSLAFDWYHERTIESELSDLEKMLKAGADLTPEQYFDRLDFPVSVARAIALRKIERRIESWKEGVKKKAELERLREERKREERRQGIQTIELPPASLYQPANFQQHFPDTPTFSPLEKERESIAQVYRDARHQARVVSDFIETIRGNPESSPQITYALALVTVLFFAGVIYPLSFMPLPLDAQFNLSLGAFWDILWSVKGALLSIVAVVFGAVLFMFFWLNLHLKYPAETLEELDRFTKLNAYSKHFQVIEQNERAGAEARDG